MRIFLTLAVLATAGYVIANATLSTAAPSPAALGPGAVIHMHEQLFAALDAGDAEKAVAFLHEDMEMDDEWRRRPCQVFLTDAKGETRQARKHAESAALLTTMAKESVLKGVTCETTVRPLSTDCFSAELSYAVLEVERAYRMGKESWTERLLCTSMVTYDEGWELTHWHLSPAPGKAAAR